ncbi:MAG: acyl-[acyl-carrier-protein] thioesterase [Roseburia sp.]
MYQFQSRVRYSEVNSEKEMTLPALLDYLQDCCTFQSEELGVGVDYLAENKVAWVLSSWQIRICRYPRMGEHITVSTWPYGFKGFYGYRNFKVEDETGAVLAYANSLWVFMDTEHMRPVRISQRMLDAYLPGMEDEIPEQWDERKITVPEGGSREKPVYVQRFHIDTNHHVNNGKYIQIAEEFLPENFEVSGLRAEYKKAAILGDVLYPVVRTEETCVTVTLADAQEKPYAIVQFQGKQIGV